MLKKFVIIALCLMALGLSAQNALAVFRVTVTDDTPLDNGPVTGLGEADNGPIRCQCWDNRFGGGWVTFEMVEVDEGVYQTDIGAPPSDYTVWQIFVDDGWVTGQNEGNPTNSRNIWPWPPNPVPFQWIVEDNRQ